MSTSFRFAKSWLLFIIFGILAVPSYSASVGSTFTYQGKLQDFGQPGSGDYDFELSIFDDPGVVTPLASRTVCGVTLEDGVFSLEVDFGAVFDGDRRWIEVGVAPAGSCDGSTIFTYLDPRQEVTATPYAMFTQEALNADQLDGLEAADFLPSSGTAVAENLTLSGSLILDPGASLIFPDGSVQTTAAAPIGPTVVHPELYVPAFLTCGDNAEDDPVQWAPIAIATFRITLQGVPFDVTANFAGIDTGQGMAPVAARIEDAIRTATGGMEVVSWDGRFVIHSDTTSATSSIGPLESTGSPVDISGAGLDPWMDCESDRGIPKEAVVDLPAYAGYIALLDESGQIDSKFRPPASKSGVASFQPVSINDTKTVVHNLGRVPKRIRIRWYPSTRLQNEGEGIFDGSSYATIAKVTTGNSRESSTLSNAYIMIVDYENFGSFNWRAVIGESSENQFKLTLTDFDRSTEVVNFLWEVE